MLRYVVANRRQLCSVSSPNGLHLVMDGVVADKADSVCSSFGLVFEGIEHADIGRLGSLQAVCNMTDVALVKAVDGRFVDQCLYVDNGNLILPGNLTFCYDDVVGAVCKEPVVTFVTTFVTPSTSTALEQQITSTVVTSAIVLEMPSEVSEFTTVFPGFTSTITGSGGSPLSTITFLPSTFTTTITPATMSTGTDDPETCTSIVPDDEGEATCGRDILCQQEEFVVVEHTSGRLREKACHLLNMQLADITIYNSLAAADVIYGCLGPMKSAWIGSYNGDYYKGECLALYTGQASPGGAIARPCSCASLLPVLCQRGRHHESVFLQQSNDAPCNITDKGIFILPGLHSVNEAPLLCASRGWNLLDIGNFNLLTFLALCEQCNVQHGWVRSVHGYIDGDGMLYFTQSRPVLGVAVGLSKEADLRKGILAPVFCQDSSARSTSASTYDDESTITTSQTKSIIDIDTLTLLITNTIVQTIITFE